jgi:hypothetical protein
MRLLLSLLLLLVSVEAGACDDICKLEKELIKIEKNPDPEAHKALGLDVLWVSEKECKTLGVWIRSGKFCSVLRQPKD